MEAGGGCVTAGLGKMQREKKVGEGKKAYTEI